MDVTDAEVIIIGGGLSGLMAARRLHAEGVRFLLIEAGSRLGGRVLTADDTGAPASDGFDLGASWFWPHVQRDLAVLIDDLGLQCFAQDFAGDVVFERMSRETPQRYRPLDNKAQSMRLAGGTATLVEALARGLPAPSLCLGERVMHLILRAGAVDVIGMAEGGARARSAGHVIAALPPRLLEATVSISPAVEAAAAERWRATATWMAPSAKFFAFYDQPFWREAGLSGTAQSFVGPMAEVHDATTASGAAALMGFVSLGADRRAALGREALAKACVAQLARIFGPEAGQPHRTLVKDWATDGLTATDLDRSAGAHPAAADEPWLAGRWAEHLRLAGSETSRFEPGFMAGAIEAGRAAAEAVLARLRVGPA